MPGGKDAARPRPLFAMDRGRRSCRLSLGLPEGETVLSDDRRLLASATRRQRIHGLDHARWIGDAFARDIERAAEHYREPHYFTPSEARDF